VNNKYGDLELLLAVEEQIEHKNPTLTVGVFGIGVRGGGRGVRGGGRAACGEQRCGGGRSKDDMRRGVGSKATVGERRSGEGTERGRRPGVGLGRDGGVCRGLPEVVFAKTGYTKSISGRRVDRIARRSSRKIGSKLSYAYCPVVCSPYVVPRAKEYAHGPGLEYFLVVSLFMRTTGSQPNYTRRMCPV
jgi:hypothetical protein